MKTYKWYRKSKVCYIVTKWVGGLQIPLGKFVNYCLHGGMLMQQMKVNEVWKHMFLVADNGVNSLSGKEEIDDELYDDDNNDNNNTNERLC